MRKGGFLAYLAVRYASQASLKKQDRTSGAVGPALSGADATAPKAVRNAETMAGAQTEAWSAARHQRQ